MACTEAVSFTAQQFCVAQYTPSPMEDVEELHLLGRAENIAPTRASSISFEDAGFGGCDGAMQIFVVTTVKTTNSCFICSVSMTWALYVCMMFNIQIHEPAGLK
jgi:hypothetical protein